MGTFPQGQIRCDQPPGGLKLSTRLARLDCRHIEDIRRIAHDSFETVWGPQDYAYFLAHEHGLCLGVFDGEERLIAYFLGIVVQGDLDVVSIATLPPHRKRGIGRQLLAEACQAAGVERAFLEVAVDNTSAITLYKKMGFLVTGVRRGYYEQKRDAYVMARVPLH